ncbi:hypothetical protein WICMUC_000565 [Wickerhamomyces mucosus]|uniref:Endonuclease/exonuclease/phosphatase domain-containing protein n=1 Tax=Wickerhamomyces mucosus TaxID=1378264 RepID=A0A9P8PYT4_9ASCO|nr:hypothetical protein WICMUC_000565 [Wickerhamomyces mucosus]
MNDDIPKKSKKGKKGSRNPVDITPEFIAEQRAKRDAIKKAKRDALIANGIDPDQIDIPKDLRFISRQMLELPTNSNSKIASYTVSIMTYNILAQALIRRKLFPTSGNALKWFKRSKVLLSEFKHYNSDVLLLQEVDYVQYNSFWKLELKKLGYESVYNRWGEKNHGIAIFYKNSILEISDKMSIDYDSEIISNGFNNNNNNSNNIITKNVGLLVSLKFKPSILSKFPNTNINKSGIIIGTTHLFWHPFGTNTRTRQTYLVLQKTQEFYNRVKLIQGGEWFKFFGGDFNSQPFDSPYLSITSKPIKYDERCKNVLGCSISYELEKSKQGQVNEEGDDVEEEEDVEGDDDKKIEETANIEKFTTPVPETFKPTDYETNLINQMQDLHNSQPLRAISLYSVGYKHVHRENSGLDNDKNEPEISNWAHTWRGLLDYIFYIDSWDLNVSSNIETLEEFEKITNVRIKKLLRMPLAKEMSNHGQPHEGEYPSDHLCMIAEVELLLE